MRAAVQIVVAAFAIVVLLVLASRWGAEPAPVSPRPSGAVTEPETPDGLPAVLAMDDDARELVEPVPVEEAHVEPSAPPVTVASPAAGFWGRVVATEDGLPVVSARVTLLDASSEPRETDLEGLFELPIESDGTGGFTTLGSSGNGLVEVEATGFGPTRASVAPGHETPAAALEIRLARSAEWTVTVVDANGGAIEGARVSLRAEAYQIDRRSFDWGRGPEWRRTAPTTQDGTCRFLDLPPEVPLQVEVQVKGQPSQREPSPLVFAAGEAAERTIRIGGGTLVRGLLLDHVGAVVPDQTIWLVHEEDAGVAYDRSYFFSGLEQEMRAQTDEEGRFELPGVRAGAWWIGPAAEIRSRIPIEDRLSPLATLLRIEPGEWEREVVLHAHRGETIRGVVLDPSGVAVPRIHVSASSTDSRGSLSARSDEKGQFTLGPLSPGSFRILAFSGSAPGDPVIAQAGDQDVIVRVAPGATLFLQAIEASSGEPCPAEYMLYGPRPSQGISSASRSGRTPRPMEMKLLPGIYDVTAVAADGRIGVLRGIEVRAGSEDRITKIPVERGAALEILYQGPQSYCQFKIFDGDVCVAGDGMRGGTSAVKTVPVGRLRIEVRMGPDAVQERWVDTVSGGKHEVSVRFE